MKSCILPWIYNCLIQFSDSVHITEEYSWYNMQRKNQFVLLTSNISIRLRIFNKNSPSAIYFFSKRIEKWIFEAKTWNVYSINLQGRQDAEFKIALWRRETILFATRSL
jgi:hypothetical protein